MSTFFTADLHFHCPGIAKSRGYDNFEDHDRIILDRLNAVVGQHDRLWILGDFGHGSYRDKIRCKAIHFLYGNHDKKIGHCFTSYGDTCLERLDGEYVFLSHYPHTYWNRSHHGSFHLYGHCHRMREQTLDSMLPNRRSMDVGLDNALKLQGFLMPFSWEYIKNRLLSREGHDPVEWYKENHGEF